MKVLYLSSVLPKRSETFVYKELLGLRRLGVDVAAASLYAPEANLGEKELEHLAAEVVTVYPGGMGRLLRDAAAWFFRHPLRAGATLALAKWDALAARDLRLKDRPKVVIQGLAGLALARRVEAAGITHVHVHMAHAAATVGMYAARALGVPFSFTGHAADLFRERCLLAAKLRRAAFVACISEWHRGWYRTIVDRPDGEYPVIRCGVDVPPEPTPPSAPRELRLAGLGRLVPKKGFDILIEACRRLSDAGEKFSFAIAGDGPELDRLKSLAAGLPVRFPGAVANRDVPALLAETDLFVLPCRVSGDGDRDGIPVVLMEAMAQGVCAVSGDLPTIRELIRDGESGCLVAPGDPAALADCLSRLAAGPELRHRLAAGGRRRVEEEFSSQKNLDRMLGALTRSHTK